MAELGRTRTMRQARQRLDYGRRDPLALPRSRIPDLRRGHHAYADDINNNNNQARADGSGGNGDGDEDVQARPVPPRRVQRWLTMGYQETLGELMT